MLNKFKNKSLFFKNVKIKTKRERLEKPKKEKFLLLLILENIGDSVLSVCKTKILTEYREKGIRCFKNQIFQIYQFF